MATLCIHHLLDGLILWLLCVRANTISIPPEAMANNNKNDEKNKLPSLYDQRYIEQGGYMDNPDKTSQYMPGTISDGYGGTPDWGNPDQSHPNKHKCVKIPSTMGLCNDVRYKEMRLPNLLGHDSLDEASQQAGSWVPLLGLRCFPDTQLFLCSLFAPVCLDRPIWPCRSLCEAVKNNCEGTMQRWGFPWPEMVRCDKFPPDNDLCIKALNTTTKHSDESICPACKQADTFEVVIDNYCNSQFAMRVRIKKVKIKRKGVRQIYTRLVLKKRKFYKRGGLKKKDVRKMIAYLENGDKCKCDRAKSGKTNYMVMGKKVGDKIYVTYLVSWPKGNKSFRRALRSMKKKDICTKGKLNIEGQPDNKRASKKSKKGRKGRKGKGRKGKGKRKGKGRGRKGKGGKRQRKNRNKSATLSTTPLSRPTVT